MSTESTQPPEGKEGTPARPPYDAERIRELRERLYTRGGGSQETVRRPIPPRVEAAVPEEAPVVLKTAPQPIPHPAPAPVAPPVSYTEPMPKRRGYSYRFWILLTGGLFFVIALAVSAALMFFGGNTISGENITLTASGPLQVGAGEELKFRIAIANQNTVPIERATLIIEYPSGTHAVTDNKLLSTDRRLLDSVAAGELVNVDLTARVYGEENEEKEIRARIEYRVAGSGATFEKRSEPLRFKMSTSPVVVSLDSIESIPSGQEVEVALTVQSNSPTPLADVLVKATYPTGFDFTEAEPDTVSGEDTWRIDMLDPGEKRTILIRGLLTGYDNDTREFAATAGVAAENDPLALASQLAVARTNITIEKAFLTLGMNINGNDDDATVIVAKGQPASVNVSFTNSLDTVINDGMVTVTFGGNALSKFEIDAQSGFYDSSKNTITWIAAEEDGLREILPGSTETFSFRVSPKNDTGTGAELTLETVVVGTRTLAGRDAEQVRGTDARMIRVESIPELTSGVYYETGPFTNSGPVPPVAESVTQYTLTLTAQAGENDIAGAEVTATLPQYVNWLDLTAGDGTVTYNASTRVVKWVVGDLEARAEAEASFQVSFKPSTSQLGRTPTLLDIQRLKATDRFTGTVVRDEASALTTRISNRDGEDERDGQVQAP